jgi:hypothetical protein
MGMKLKVYNSSIKVGYMKGCVNTCDGTQHENVNLQDEE